jgi:hypothetical protein
MSPGSLLHDRYFAKGAIAIPFSPVAATRESFAHVKNIYQAFGAEIFEGVHEFHGARGLPFLSAALTA